jgi:hypothetical protein
VAAYTSSRSLYIDAESKTEGKSFYLGLELEPELEFDSGNLKITSLPRPLAKARALLFTSFN